MDLAQLPKTENTAEEIAIYGFFSYKQAPIFCIPFAIPKALTLLYFWVSFYKDDEGRERKKEGEREGGGEKERRKTGKG